MKLYHAPRTRSFRAVWMLEELGVPYEIERIDINAGDQNKPEYAALNPMRKVPFLIDGDEKIGDSAAICLYLAEKYPEKGLAIMPGEPGRGAFLQWMIFSVAILEPAFAEKFGGWTVNERSHAWGSFDRMVEVFEKGLERGPWILGERFTAADVMVGSGAHWGVQFGILKDRAKIAAYAARVGARPALKRALAMDEAG